MRTILPIPRAVLFDMDGTITRPMLDFDAIRAEMGIRGPILEAMRSLHGERLAAATAVLHRHEREAAEGSELNDGCRALLDDLATRGIPTAIVTRNSRANIAIVLQRHALRFDLVLSRDCAPPKPDPTALLNACKHFGVEPADTWMIGDGSHDVEAGIAAGMPTIWIANGERRSFAAEPSVSVEGLIDVRTLLRAAFDADAFSDS